MTLGEEMPNPTLLDEVELHGFLADQYPIYEMDNFLNGSQFFHNFSMPDDDSWMSTRETSLQKMVDYVLVIFISIVGIIGNTVAFYLLTKVTFRRFSYAAYLRYLAVCDTINLIIELTLKVDELCIWNIHWSFMSYNNAVTCKLWEFTRHTCIIVSSWLVAAFSMDRLVAVTCPLFKLKFCTVNWARVMTVVLCVLCASSQVFRLVYITSTPRQPEHILSPCFPDPEYRHMYFVANSFFSNFGMRFLLPFVIISTSNCLVLRILRVHGPRRKFKGDTRATSRNNARQTRLAKSALYLVCAYFILTMLPSASLEMTWYVYQSRNQIEQYVKLLPYQVPFSLLRFTNYAVNFFLYCASFRSFRHELRLLRYKFRCPIKASKDDFEYTYDKKSSNSSGNTSSADKYQKMIFRTIPQVRYE